MNERTFHPSRAQRLEDPERLVWMPPDHLIRLLDLAPGMTVADVGAGTGFFAIPFAKAIGRQGTVWAIDVQPEMLQMLTAKLTAPGSPDNVRLREGTALGTGLAEASCDLAFYANIWHELEQWESVLAEARRILKPSGRMAILDWRADRSSPPGPPAEHRITLENVEGQVTGEGWRVLHSGAFGEHSYLLAAAPPMLPPAL